jgi:phenylpyruvate tautomerase PptA (4-oxalocrotonate tautomerase family)
MPYLQLDTNQKYPIETKQHLAKTLGDIFAKFMHANINRVTVAIRELGEGSGWRCSDGEPYPSALLMCDIRQGRPPEMRAELAEALIRACVEILGLRIEQLNVEFTQHAGDEMYHPMLGGLSDDWTPAEE